MDRATIIKALKEEIDAVEKADGKGVASKDPKEVSGACADGVKNAAGGGVTGGEGAKGGKSAEGAEKPAIEKADGKSVESANTGDAKVGGGAADGKAVCQADGKSVATADTKISPDLKGMDNAVGESITLPHDVLVEMNGKQMTLKAGTKVCLVKEEEECKDEKKDEKKDKKVEKKDKKVEESKKIVNEEIPDFLKDEGTKEAGEEAEGEEAGEEAGGAETEFGAGDIPGGDEADLPAIVEPEKEIEVTALDKIVASLEDVAAGFREFAAEEKGEPQHGGEEAGTGEQEEKENKDFSMQLESYNKRKGKLVK
jgi:hypothetical protein